MSLAIDQIDTKPPQLEHDGQPSSAPVLPSTLTVSQRGPVTLLRLSRPAKRNALDLATIAGLGTFFSDPPKETRVVVLFGEGKHFSAGADLRSFADTSAWDRVLISETWHRAFDRIENAGVPVIAHCTAGSSVAVWSSPPPRTSGWLNATHITPFRRVRGDYSLAAAAPCACRA